MSATHCWHDLLIPPARRAKGDPGIAQITFPSGIDVHFSNLPIKKGAEITMPVALRAQRLCAMFFITGKTQIRLGNGHLGHWSPKTACLLRADTPGLGFIALESGWIAHVCVAMRCDDLATRFADETPAVLRDYLCPTGPVDAIRPVRPTNRMIAAAMALHKAGLDNVFARSRCEALALQLLIEAVAALQLPPPVKRDQSICLYEQARALHAAVTKDPTADFPGALGTGPSLRQQRAVLQMFETSYGISLRSYRHKLVMEKARAALTAGTLIKQLAYDLGYAHVANFTRAYRRAFGESPSKTLRRRAQAKQ
jgi:hypothetical protein